MAFETKSPQFEAEIYPLNALEYLSPLSWLTAMFILKVTVQFNLPVPQPAARLPKLAKVINKSLIKSSFPLLFYPSNKAFCPVTPLISLILSSSLIYISFHLMKSPVISNERVTFSRGQSMRRTRRHVLKTVAQQGRWLINVPVLPSQQGKDTRSVPERGQPARRAPSASSSQGCSCSSCLLYHLASPFCSNEVNDFFKRCWDSS